jgi:hypothetical protein
MSMPADRVCSKQHELEWDDEQNTIRVHSTGSSTIVFDSFSSEADVQRRNLAANNISKLNQPERRFATEFNVCVSGDVTAILSASSVASYRTSDGRCNAQRRPDATPPPPLAASFSSVIMMGQSSPQVVSSASSCSASPLVVSSATPPATSASPPTDSELIAALAEEAAPSSSSPRPSMSFMNALSTVANQRVSASSTTSSSNRTDQLRKRCHDMLQQRTQRSNVHFQTVVFPPPAKRQCNLHHQGNDKPPPAGGADDRTTAAAAASSPPTASFFFASVPRPTEVHQTLVQATQNHLSKLPAAEAGHPLRCGGTSALPARGAHGNDARAVQPTSPPICNHGLGVHHPPASPVNLSSRPGSPSSPPLRISACTTSDAELTSMMGGSAFTPLYRRSQPPPPYTPDDSLLYDLRHQPRLSSSDLLFSSMACPVPVNGLLNLSDIHFRRSSEELIALSVLQELHTKK